MKKKLKMICSAVLLCAAVAGLTACAKWNTPYDTLDEQGYTVSVRFDANGGVFAGTNDVYVVDVFRADEGEIKLLTPDDARRQENAFTITRSYYYLAGWYQTRELRTDEAGRPLDDYGALCSQSGRPQGYIYNDRWDFDRDRLTPDQAKASSADNTMTLYAAWIPYVNYELYAQNTASGAWERVGEPIQAIDLELPKWNASTGKLDSQKFPTRDGYTFDKAYTDQDLTQPITETLKGNYNEERGILSHNGTVKIYTEWLTGEWFHIYNAKQFYSNAKADGHYVLHADLDFAGQIWKPNLTSTPFTGSIIGNGHKISNINVLQSAGANERQVYGGLFGQITEQAELRDVTFENVSYTLVEGSRAPISYFGLLAGEIADGATISGVSVSGKLKIDANRYPAAYNLGLVCGTGHFDGIDPSGITCVEINGDEETPLSADPQTGKVTLPAAQAVPSAS